MKNYDDSYQKVYENLQPKKAHSHVPLLNEVKLTPDKLMK
jgi:hypothetical protein